jgi:hypothetical protein
MSRNLPLALAAVLGLGAAANGLFMLISPAKWYFAVPGVTTTGPFNQHFVRDIGLIFLLVATAMLAGVARPASCAVPFLGGGGRHLWDRRARSGFSCGDPTSYSDDRSGPLGLAR